MATIKKYDGKPIPESAPSETTEDFWGKVPDNPTWRAYIKGQLLDLTENWDESTGDVTAATAKGEDIVESLEFGVLPMGVTDHGDLTGLTPDDDHPQYLTPARGDARYSGLSHSHVNYGGQAFWAVNSGSPIQINSNGSWVQVPLNNGQAINGAGSYLEGFDNGIRSLQAGVYEAEIKLLVIPSVATIFGIVLDRIGVGLVYPVYTYGYTNVNQTLHLTTPPLNLGVNSHLKVKFLAGTSGNQTVYMDYANGWFLVRRLA